jgi:hypothetical protein
VPDQLTAQGVSDAKRDALVMRVALALFISGMAVLLLLALAASLSLGILRPSCDGQPLNNRVGGCYVAPNAVAAPAATSNVPSLTGVQPTLTP